jgi:hypothetical protein
MANNDHHWAVQPIDPLELHWRLAAALDPSGDFTALTAQEIVSAELPDVQDEAFRDKYLLREVLRKYPDFDLGIDTRQVAKDAFYADEAVNAQTNERLLGLPDDPAVARVFQFARRKIAEVLGVFDERAFWRSWRFGPHSTLSLPRGEATPENKMMLEKPTVPAKALGLAKALLSREPHLAYSQEGGERHSLEPSDDGPNFVVKCIDLTRQLAVCEYDRWMSVSKNAKTDRGIGIPSDFGVMMQLALGRIIRALLYLAGINLNDQSHNQRLAALGSRDGRIATVDVRSASQSVVCGLVWNLIGAQPVRDLDPRWYVLLDALRAPCTLVDGDMHENELFSAMGNGYTFELESLIFYALAHGVCTELGVDTSVVSVYGDDITVPGNPRVGDLLTEVFRFAGFRINLDKSFGLTKDSLDEPHHFRESCGKHYRDGVDVTPFYIDSSLNDPFQIVLAYNNLIRWASNGLTRDRRVYPVAVWLLSHLGPGYRESVIPLSEGNDGIIVDFDEALPFLQVNKSPHVFDPNAPKGRVKGLGADGYLLRVFSFETRQTELPDYLRYLRTIYTGKPCSSGFKPPESQNTWPPQGFRSLRIKALDVARKQGKLLRDSSPRWLSLEDWCSVVPDPPKVEGVKVNLRRRRRHVYDWTWLGPWVFDDLPYASDAVGVLFEAQRGWDRLDRSHDVFVNTAHHRSR